MSLYNEKRPRTPLKVDIRKLVEVGCVVDALDLDGYGSRSVTDVLPVAATEEHLGLNLLPGAEPVFGITTQPGWADETHVQSY